METIEVKDYPKRKATLVAKSEFRIHWRCTNCKHEHVESWEQFDVDWTKPHVCPKCGGK